jgi:hypothetical protein
VVGDMLRMLGAVLEADDALLELLVLLVLPDEVPLELVELVPPPQAVSVSISNVGNHRCKK